MNKIIECVPNFSEGRDAQKIVRIVSEIEQVQGVKLLNVESDTDYNRTVVTFAGKPEAVKDAAFYAIEMAAEVIDMSKHKGAHPRIGATDVCPFVPVANVTMDECVQIARVLGKKVGEWLGIPVYLYGEAAMIPERHLLPDIRKGEYESLPERLKDEKWRPDYGHAEFNDNVRKTGATVIGAREFLIAYNVNLDTQNIQIANKISGIVRASGVVKINEKGEKVRIPGLLKFVQAMGVHLKEHNITQVSMNLLNYKVAPPHVAFEEVKKQAGVLGVRVTGSEIVGLVPKEALLTAGRFYSKEPSEERIIAVAVERLGLSQLNKFIPGKKVIEYMLA
ncbi:MAG: glutamate formimidoyltransferase [Candidatus Brocadia sp. AMX2]|uniref:glutamate formimidoyltransferase n=1 Tax=Candidatus Brocadia sinica JPN1 TaxID=1197129 RepID=A0ABQ0JT13_9BACT|nr:MULTISPECIES: glutamate formimidoyltransferase [Brocadia]KXK30577.1 MAG: glutamate formimidoyltransferase [Candidatus Brocadia sinica]MBC6931626.1 glutamate formimidoyltransferase [Candidatus Brocadia sp.]MBL1169009.1 glutamate formimidoyltransferase [Candidatus Brocadia sp. AMX1]NOG43441.1 glutamate formimidoyltransferase [Planctomycetota bacterium]KAA0245224.1 MAG: glutamate formimidoyltransferase [Candidatus Brocadia sp. AMX2]